MARRPVRVRAAADAVAWGVALVLAALVRFDLHVSLVDFGDLALFALVAVMVNVAVGVGTGLYLGRWRFGSFEEVAALAVVIGLTTLVLSTLDLWVLPRRLLPISVSLAAGVIALVLTGAIRYVWRLELERRQRPRGGGYQRLLVLGAGEGGAGVVRSLLRSADTPYLPVALLDDDPTKRRLTIMGVPVVGTRRDLAEVAAIRQVDAVLIAIPSASSELVREVSVVAAEIGIDFKVVPPVRELYGAPVSAADIRSVTEVDLLGRREIETDVGAIADYVAGKRVMVTGAGGSIGSELCRQLERFGPAELILVDRDESALHAVELSIHGRALLESSDTVLVELRDQPAVDALFAERRPEVVFHAAALKHLPLLERYPAEAVKSNVWATLNVLRAAGAVDVERFVNISTDKAAAPISVLGYSKRISERLTAELALSAAGTYLSVRFGNVLGSRGSVLVAFRTQIDAGGPVTVTDPDVTRYFMTVAEAVELVIQAGAIGADGEVLILDMGQPVRIADVAERLVAAAERRVEIVYTGLRPGEKLHEVLMGDDEEDYRPLHPLISHAQVPPLCWEDALTLDATGPGCTVVSDLRSLAYRDPLAPAEVGELAEGADLQDRVGAYGDGQ